MNKKDLKDYNILRSAAENIASQLKIQSAGTKLRIRRPGAHAATRTDGWLFSIGDLGKGAARLLVWFDRFTGYSDRRFYACFGSVKEEKIVSISKHISRNLATKITDADAIERKFYVLKKLLVQSQFERPIIEHYAKNETYLGIYCPTRSVKDFCSLAVGFFLECAQAMPGAHEPDEQAEVYPQTENRPTVTSHIRRERSQLLSAACKVRDKFKCQVCGFKYEPMYGKLGDTFAEAHHRVPLSLLRENVRTSLDDLVTVCANCHRMLHRMNGERDDIFKLRAIVHRQKKRH